MTVASAVFLAVACNTYDDSLLRYSPSTGPTAATARSCARPS